MWIKMPTGHLGLSIQTPVTLGEGRSGALPACSLASCLDAALPARPRNKRVAPSLTCSVGTCKPSHVAGSPRSRAVRPNFWPPASKYWSIVPRLGVFGGQRMLLT